MNIWENLLEFSSINIEYGAFKKKVFEQPYLIQKVEEVIVLDVQRSAHTMPNVDTGMLTSVLKTYALYNPEIEYFQGMNYIAGFLLSLYPNEEIAFKVLTILVEKF
jgi:hypothetical protein